MITDNIIISSSEVCLMFLKIPTIIKILKNGDTKPLGY